MTRTCLTIVLAAGEGTRMRSSLPKMLHQVAGQSLLAHVLRAVRQAADGATVVIVGPDRDDVAQEARRVIPSAEIAVQHPTPIVQVLQTQRRVQTILVTQRGKVGSGRPFSQHLLHRIAGHQVDEQKH